MTSSILWRRLDTPGHDTCRLDRSDTGWTLHGAAVFRDEDGPAALRYEVMCDQEWRTLEGRVDGWLGERRVGLRIGRTPSGTWTMNGAAVQNVEGHVDLDLGFTPATNLPVLRRMALAHGESAEVSVAWLDDALGSLSSLPQRYERRSGATYWYESPTAAYEGFLEVDPTGFILRYPDLWEAEA